MYPQCDAVLACAAAACRLDVQQHMPPAATGLAGDLRMQNI
jgi:hypothetical protein